LVALLLFDLSPGIDNDAGATDERTAAAGGATKSSASAAAISLSLRGILVLAPGPMRLLCFSAAAKRDADGVLSTGRGACDRATGRRASPPGREVGNIDEANTETAIAANANQIARRRMMR
jgi:hypothetical protein